LHSPSSFTLIPPIALPASYPPTLTFCPFCSTAPTSSEISALSLHDALPISAIRCFSRILFKMLNFFIVFTPKWIFSCLHARKYRSEEHTSELQSRFDLVCRLLLEKKKETHKGDLYTLLNNGDQKR